VRVSLEPWLLKHSHHSFSLAFETVLFRLCFAYPGNFFQYKVWQLNVSSNLFPNTRLEENYEQICDIDVLPVDLKGILHPKMKMLSWFTHPNVVATLYEFLSSAEKDVLKNVWNFGFIDFHSIFFSAMEVNGAKQLFGSNRSSKYLNFWVEYPFKQVNRFLDNL